MGWRDVNLPYVKELVIAMDKFKDKSIECGPPLGFAKMVPFIERCQLIGDTRFDDKAVCELLMDSIRIATKAVEEGFVFPGLLDRLEVNVIAMEKLAGFTAQPVSHEETPLGTMTKYIVKKKYENNN